MTNSSTMVTATTSARPSAKRLSSTEYCFVIKGRNLKVLLVAKVPHKPSIMMWMTTPAGTVTVTRAKHKPRVDRMRA
jgi:hypothetical protein